MTSSYSELLKAENFLLTSVTGGSGNAWRCFIGNKKLSALTYPPGDRKIAGHLSYEMKNDFEKLSSRNPGRSGFPENHFVETENEFELNLAEIPDQRYEYAAIHLQARTPRAIYLSNVNKLISHIHRGDIYEINYCIEFFAENVSIDPLNVFLRLNELTKAPHACLYKCGDAWLLCASPERFLKKTGKKIISQPIKGTRPRGKTPEEDERLKTELKNDPKEISENVMIVDLVRNDLSRIADKGSVNVDELCGIYSFESVHQMISTVSADVREDVSFEEIIRATFPMGSMTGAPKFRAMQLIDEFEDMNRGIYSGSVGVIQPNGDFDLNVVIRSIEYNSKTGYLSVKVGSAITANCDPEKEYEECLVKAQPMLRALNAVIS